MGEPRNICKLFAKDGSCRFGHKCKFQHVLNGTGGGNGPSTAGPSRAMNARPGHRANRTQPSSAAPRGATEINAPRNVCRAFWGTGTCGRFFECTFQHIQEPTAAPVGTPTALESSLGDEPDFFSNEGFVSYGGATQSRDKRVTLDPTSAHNNIQPFLKSNYSFVNTSNILAFTNILASVNDNNKAWVRFLNSLLTTPRLGAYFLATQTSDTAQVRLCSLAYVAAPYSRRYAPGVPTDDHQSGLMLLSMSTTRR